MARKQAPDTKRLDKLQRLTTGYGLGWVLRLSSTGRGVRLHESSRVGATASVRQAIDSFDERVPRSSYVAPDTEAQVDAAEALCCLLEEQLAAWNDLFPNGNATAYSETIRAAVAKWRETLR